MTDPLTHLRDRLEPPWCELTEARVLNRIQSELAREDLVPQARPTRAGRGRVALLATAAAACVGLYLWRHPRVEPAPAAAAPVAAVASSSLKLTDGSQVQLALGAQVTTVRDGADGIELRQLAGRVRYEVVPNPRRTFLVRANEVSVRVIGTIFVVELCADTTLVSVERGRVQVNDGARQLSLATGERLELSRPPREPVRSAPTPLVSMAPVIPPPGIDTAPARLDPAAEFREVDAARRRGDLAAASEGLRRLTRSLGADPRSASAWFTLGRVEAAQGHPAAAAQAFERCRSLQPAGALAEDALAETASAWRAAGDRARAVEAATLYLSSYPSGSHAERMRHLVGATTN